LLLAIVCATKGCGAGWVDVSRPLLDHREHGGRLACCAEIKGSILKRGERDSRARNAGDADFTARFENTHKTILRQVEPYHLWSGRQVSVHATIEKPGVVFRCTLDGSEADRWLSFFFMVLTFSRQMFVEFTVSQTMEHFLACHEHAFAALGGVPSKITCLDWRSAWIANLVNVRWSTSDPTTQGT
jgi:transposase